MGMLLDSLLDSLVSAAAHELSARHTASTLSREVHAETYWLDQAETWLARQQAIRDTISITVNDALKEAQLEGGTKWR